jgi:hypothetical protein
MAINPNLPKITIYSKNLKGQKSEEITVEERNSAAQSIVRVGKTISKGEETERLQIDFFGDTTIYNIAIQTLTPSEQKSVEKAGHAGWFKKYYWAPLRIGDQVILININSAVKRLGMMGISEDNVRGALSHGNLLEMIKEKQIDKLKRALDVQLASIKGDRSDIYEKIFQSIEDKRLTMVTVKRIAQYASTKDLTLEEAYQNFLHPESAEVYAALQDISIERAERVYQYAIDNKIDFIDLSYIFMRPDSKKVSALEKRAIERYANSSGLTFEEAKINLRTSVFLGISLEDTEAFRAKKNLSNQQVKDTLVSQQAFFNRFSIEQANRVDRYASENEIPLMEAIDIFMHPESEDGSIKERQEIEDYANRYGLNKDDAKIILRCSAFLGVSLEDIEVFRTKNNLSHEQVKDVLDYQRAFGVPTLEVAHKAIEQLKARRVSEEEIRKISIFVQEHLSAWTQQASIAPIYVRVKDFPGQLPHNLQVNVDGTIYLLFNRVSKHGDKLLGQGGFKKAKEAMELVSASMAARISMVITDPSLSEMAKSELDLSIRLSGQEGIAHTFQATALEYESGSWKVKKLGYMQKLYNGGDLMQALGKGEVFSEDEKKFITHRLLKGLAWLNGTQHLIHRDLKPGNIYFIRDPVTQKVTDIVIGDFGLTCGTTDVVERGRIVGTSIYMPPEMIDILYGSGDSIIDASTTKWDSWSMGLILFELYRSSVPGWKGKTPPMGSREVNVLVGHWLPEPGDRNSITHVIWQMLQMDPSKRISSRTALRRLERRLEKA